MMRAAGTLRLCVLLRASSPLVAHSKRHAGTGEVSDVRSMQGQVQRTVDKAGFQTTLALEQPEKYEDTAMLTRAEKRVKAGQNVLLVGAAGTGKRTFLARVREMLPNRHVAVVSANPYASMRLDGIPTAPFFGLKPYAEVLNTDTCSASLARHVRAINGSFAHCFPSLATCDVLVMHALEALSPYTLAALDLVAREERKSDKPFGGLQVVASADFWKLEVSPSSELTGNMFQLPEWANYFPPGSELPLARFFKHDLKADPRASQRAVRALFGTLTDKDIAELSTDRVAAEQSGDPSAPVTLITDRKGFLGWAPQFPRQPAIVTPPAKKMIMRQSSFGQYLAQTLSLCAYTPHVGLCKRLHFAEGDEVALAFPMVRTAEGKKTLPAGTRGIISSISDHFINVRVLDTKENLSVPRLRIHTRHSHMPELGYATTQYPLYNVRRLFPRFLIDEQVPVPRVKQWHIDARVLTATGDLGNLLSILPTSKGVFTNLADYLRRDGYVYEPARVYCERLLRREDRETAQVAGLDLSEREERWCRNCKTHVPGSEFHEHWDKCINSVRWCADCSVTVPAEKWAAHCEKHTVVMCLDCGRALEWRYWEQHRKLCGPMLRELSADNEYLPSSTRTTTLEASIDRSDLHTVRAISRSMLPRRHTDVEAGHRARSYVQ